MLHSIDLFGNDFSISSLSNTVGRTLRPVQKRLRTPRETANLELFDISIYLEQPLISVPQVAEQPTIEVEPIATVCNTACEVAAEDDELYGDMANPVISPEASWGSVWVTDRHGFEWSKAGCIQMQHMLLQRSIELLTLIGFPKDKFDVLRWVFAPAVRQVYYAHHSGRIITGKVHQRDEPFSFHNCCIASAMNADTLREGIERNLPKVLVDCVQQSNVENTE